MSSVGGCRVSRPSCDATCTNDTGMNFAQPRKASEIPAGLEQHRQQLTAVVASRVRAHEGQARLGQIVSKAEFLAAQPCTRTRIGCAVDSCHDVSGKGCAGEAVRSVWFEGLIPRPGDPNLL